MDGREWRARDGREWRARDGVSGERGVGVEREGWESEGWGGGEQGMEGSGELLKNIKPYKEAGPDQIKPLILKKLHSEIAPKLTHVPIYLYHQESYQKIGKMQTLHPFSKRDKAIWQQITALFHPHALFANV